ncbi:MAG: cation-translocating P-type ATPase [Spirosomataceae bacterium]
MIPHWHLLPPDEVLKQTDTSSNGLSSPAAREKLEKEGRNELRVKRKRSPVVLFLQQFLNVMILVLVAAAIISGIMGDLSDTYVILGIIILNSVIGFVQEYRAEKAMEALGKLAVPTAKVIRDGIPADVPSPELVKGDIVLLEAGNTVPADVRLLEVHSLKIEEAGLTGESQPVDKTTEPLKEENPPLGDRTNMAFSGTNITNGRAKGVVVATGMASELGKIAGMLQEEGSETPLQKRMAQFGRRLTVIILVLCAALFLAGYLRGEEIGKMLLTSISLAVAAIPEALPAVITVSLSLGASRLAKKNALVRKLYAVETLGSVTYICTDKTGTLTKNKMEVKERWLPNEGNRQLLLQAMALNQDVQKQEKKLTGDPTEIALLEYTRAQEGFENQWLKDMKRIHELPFDSERKAMTTIHEYDGKYYVFTKGAAESIAKISEGADEPIKKEEERLAAAGMRVLAYAAKVLDTFPKEIKMAEIENKLTFLGLAGLIDPPREEAHKAIEECKAAGIVPVMITGDHPLTAATIAREIGILDNERQKVITGNDLDGLSEAELKKQVLDIRVYARVSPEQKLNIVKALQAKDQFVSMTGDGVNDAPSLKRANIGVAMGITGTDVTKEAAHMILLDDNFATIIKAVREGRRIYDNITKFIKYIMTGNAAEIWSIFLAPLIGLPIPLLPVHILWVNLVTDGLPALALAAEPAEKKSMHLPPRAPKESIFANRLGIHIIWVGILIGVLTVGTQWFEIKTGDKHWQTIVFTVLCLSQLWHVMAIRSHKESLFTQGLLTNKPLLGAVLLTVALQMAVIYVPFLNNFFHTQPLTWQELSTAFGVSSVAFWAVEVEKIFKRRKK